MLQLDVKEAKVIEDHPQWDISDTEDEAGDQDQEASNDSDYSTDMDDSEDEWSKQFITVFSLCDQNDSEHAPV